MIRFLRYLGSGGTATLVDVGVFALLNRGLGLWYVWAFVGSALAGLVTNFLLSRQFVFAVRWENTFRQLLVFTGVALNGMVLNLVIMKLLVDLLHWDTVWARVLSAGMVVGVSFVGHSLFSFRKVGGGSGEL
ncbi:GtrA family protein [Candidatus Cyanaurora vandensis]|uniref:GtrA family protein n=1 Tax=Candidatus Cyanaurora vandensis TaxID=2714958 RepID=UPI00257F0C36|nr:GtrA family protein [Candidatus Cyanaurora vandensis]